MSIARSFRALEFYDVLANLVPGSVFLLAIGVVVKVEKYVQFSNGTVAAGIFLVSALVIGHVIQAFASWLDGTPTLFGDIIRATRDEDVEDLSVDITHVEEAIWPMMKRKFGLPDGYEDYGGMFRLLLSYIETTPATRALRFQALHSFHRSMWAVWFLVIIITAIALLLNCANILVARSWAVLLGTVLVSFPGILFFRQRKEKFNQRFIQYAIADFYSDQIDEINDRSQGQSGS